MCKLFKETNSFRTTKNSFIRSGSHALHVSQIPLQKHQTCFLEQFYFQLQKQPNIQHACYYGSENNDLTEEQTEITLLSILWFPRLPVWQTQIPVDAGLSALFLSVWAQVCSSGHWVLAQWIIFFCFFLLAVGSTVGRRKRARVRWRRRVKGLTGLDIKQN